MMKCKDCTRKNVDCTPHGGRHDACFTAKLSGTLKAFKGFEKNLCCRGHQYEIGKEYTESTADLCNAGYHACEAPLDTFGYYPPSTS